MYVLRESYFFFVQHLSWSFNDVLHTCVSCFKLLKEFTHLCTHGVIDSAYAWSDCPQKMLFTVRVCTVLRI